MNLKIGLTLGLLAVLGAASASTNGIVDSPETVATPTSGMPGAPVPGDYMAQIRDDHDRNTLYFTWAPAGMDRHNRLSRLWPEDHYRVCLFIGDSCDRAETAQVFEVIPAEQDIPPYRYRPSDHDLKANLAFQERQFNWSVSACIRTTGQCSEWSKPLPINWTQKRLPVLLYPEDGETRDPMIETMFRWDATADVDFYLLCLAKPAIECPTRMVPRNDDVFVLVLRNNQRRAYLDTLLNEALANGPIEDYPKARLHGQQMVWHVAICRDGECVYQPKGNTIRFDRGRANIFVRNHTRFDINALWLVGPGDKQRTLLTHDLNNYARPRYLEMKGGLYDEDYLARVERHHKGIQEPNVAPYYHFEYVREMAGVGGPFYEQRARATVSFAPGVAPIPGYKVERETVFILEDGSYFEQLLRGVNDQRYLYRPGGSFEQHPAVGEGPLLLETAINSGYDVY